MDLIQERELEIQVWKKEACYSNMHFLLEHIQIMIIKDTNQISNPCWVTDTFGYKMTLTVHFLTTVCKKTKE